MHSPGNNKYTEEVNAPALGEQSEEIQQQSSPFPSSSKRRKVKKASAQVVQEVMVMSSEAFVQLSFDEGLHR